jgi:hypothetical protein
MIRRRLRPRLLRFAMRQRLQLIPDVEGGLRRKQHLLPNCLVPFEVEHQLVFASRHLEPLEEPVELVDGADEISVDIDFGGAWLDLDPRGGRRQAFACGAAGAESDDAGAQEDRADWSYEWK